MFTKHRQTAFEQAILPHLDAAYNLARWLTHNDQDAEDIVQESCVRALKYFGGFRGGDPKAWLLTIVRNTSYSFLRRHRVRELTLSLDEELLTLPSQEGNPEQLVLKRLDVEAVYRAVESLPVEFREMIVLREMEGLSYREIAEVAEMPIGTVMSRLARARTRLQQCLKESQVRGVCP